MKFKCAVKFLSYEVATLSDGKSKYAKVCFYDEASRRSVETGFMISQATAEMDSYLSLCSFGDDLVAEYILRPSTEKATLYKLGLVGVSA